jgi:hypothetical protein
MLKNWSRIALASVLVLMLGVVAANATTSRVRSLANVGDYISDDSAVNRWYSTLVSFGNQVNAEMGDWTNTDLTDSRGLGWNLTCGEDGKWGTYRVTLDEASLSHPGFWIGNPFYQTQAPQDLGFPVGSIAFPYNNTPLNRWDIAGAWEIGDAFAVGASITQSKWFVDDAATPFKSDNSWLVLGLGGTWTNNDNMVLDVLFNFGNAGGKTEAAGVTTEWDSGTAFEFAGRLFWDWKDNVTLVPVFDYAQSDYSLKSSAGPLATPNGQKTSSVMLGVGLNMDVNQDNMLVFALEWADNKAEYSNADNTAPAAAAKASLTYMPTLRLALESDITPWLTTRIGAAKYIGTLKVENQAGQEVKTGPGQPWDYNTPNGFDWFLGCGFNFAEWTVDMELASETPFGLGYWLTGYNQIWDETSGGFGPVGRISAVYNY